MNSREAYDEALAALTSQVMQVLHVNDFTPGAYAIHPLASFTGAAGCKAFDVPGEFDIVGSGDSVVLQGEDGSQAAFFVVSDFGCHSVGRAYRASRAAEWADAKIVARFPFDDERGRIYVPMLDDDGWRDDLNGAAY